MSDENRLRQFEIALLLVKFTMQLSGILLFWSGIRCLSGAPGLAGFFREFGYSAGAIRLVGAVQIICGVGLLLPKARHLTALATGTVLLLAGSAEIHQQQTALPAGTGWKLVIPGLCLLVPTLVRHYVTRRLNTGTLLLPPTAGGRRSGASSSAVRRCV